MAELEFSLSGGARAKLAELHGKIKELRSKRAKIAEEIIKTKNEISAFRGASPNGAKASAKKPKKQKAKWHSEYLFFITTSGSMAAAGRNAKQNDELVAKHLSEDDLFFHADIQGAPTTILKGGKAVLAASKSGDESASASLLETAQWAASYSSAWKTGVAAVDVYAMFSHQVSKHAQGGYVGRGAFALAGEREWFRATPLGLKIGMESNSPAMLPACHKKQLQKQTLLVPGKLEKEEAAKKLSAALSAQMDEIRGLLPAGKFAL